MQHYSPSTNHFAIYAAKTLSSVWHNDTAIRLAYVYTYIKYIHVNSNARATPFFAAYSLLATLTNSEFDELVEGGTRLRCTWPKIELVKTVRRRDLKPAIEKLLLLFCFWNLNIEYLSFKLPFRNVSLATTYGRRWALHF